MPDEIPIFFNNRQLREVPGIGPKSATRLSEWGIETMNDAVDVGELSLSRFTTERFASWLIQVYDGATSDEVSPLRSRKSISKEHTFKEDHSDIDVLIERLQTLVEKVINRAHSLGVSGRVAEVKIRYRGFETHTHQRALTVAMDDPEVFRRLAMHLFAEQLEINRPVRLIGFRLGQLEMPLSRQTTLLLEEE